MLQWVGAPAPAPETCIYNVFENGQLGSCLHNLQTGARRVLPLPVASVARDGTKALCINMPRMYDFRPGYGYEELPDPFAQEAAPSRDGIWLMDLARGSVRLILTLAQVVEFLEHAGAGPGGAKAMVNHIAFNPSASRFLFLLRTFDWRTFLVTADATGGHLRNHRVWNYASHYHWRDDDGMLFYARVADGEGHTHLALISDSQGSRRIIDAGYFHGDGHCSYSPDRRWILYDSYPGAAPDYPRALLAYSLERRRGFTLGRFASQPQLPESPAWDARCDLHPRWMPGGRSVTFDSIHEGFRAVYAADLRTLTGR